jgi:hypothetical protein
MAFQMYIFNRNLEMVAATSSNLHKALLIRNDKHVISGETFTQTFDFEALKVDEVGHEHSDVKYLKVGNYIVFKDKLGKDRLFTIMSTESDDVWMTVHCEGMSFDMINEVVGPWSDDSSKSFQEWANILLAGSSIYLSSGIHDDILTARKTMPQDGVDTKMLRWQQLMERFGYESDFFVSLATGSLADFKKDGANFNPSIGYRIQRLECNVWRASDVKPGDDLQETLRKHSEGKKDLIAQRYENKHDLETVKEKIDMTTFCNAVYVDFGKKPTKEELDSQNQWLGSHIVSPDGKYTKPMNSMYVLSTESFKTWKRPKNLIQQRLELSDDISRAPGNAIDDGYIIAVLNNSDGKNGNPRDIFDKAVAQLKANDQPIFSYEVTLKQDYDSSGQALGSSYFGANKTFAKPGSWVQIVHDQFHPALFLQAKIKSVTYVYTEVGKDTCEISNAQRVTPSIIDLTKAYVGTITEPNKKYNITSANDSITLTANFAEKYGAGVLNGGTDDSKFFKYEWTRTDSATQQVDQAWVNGSRAVVLHGLDDANFLYQVKITRLKQEKVASLVVNAQVTVTDGTKKNLGATLWYPDGTSFTSVDKVPTKRVMARVVEGTDNTTTKYPKSAFTWKKVDKNGTSQTYKPTGQVMPYEITETKDQLSGFKVTCDVDEGKAKPTPELPYSGNVDMWGTCDIKTAVSKLKLNPEPAAQQQIQVIDDNNLYMSYNIANPIGSDAVNSFYVFKCTRNPTTKTITHNEWMIIKGGGHGDGFYVYDNALYVFQRSNPANASSDMWLVKTAWKNKTTATFASTTHVANYGSTDRKIVNIGDYDKRGVCYTIWSRSPLNTVNVYAASNPTKALEMTQNLNDATYGYNPQVDANTDEGVKAGELLQTVGMSYPYVFYSFGGHSNGVADWTSGVGDNDFGSTYDPRQVWCTNIEHNGIVFKHKYLNKTLKNNGGMMYTSEMEGISALHKEGTSDVDLYFGYRYSIKSMTHEIDYIYHKKFTHRDKGDGVKW